MNNSNFYSIPPHLNNESAVSVIDNPSANTGLMDGQDGNNEHLVSIPLGQWKGLDEVKSRSQDLFRFTKNEQASLIRKLTVAYAVTKVLHHISGSQCIINDDNIKRLFSVDNFVVKMRDDELSDLSSEVKGIDVIFPSLSVQISSNRISSCARFDFPADVSTGRNVEVTVRSNGSKFCHQRLVSEEEGCDERTLCYMLGHFLHSFFCGDDPQALLLLDNERFLRCRETGRLDFSSGLLSSHQFSDMSTTGSEIITLENIDESIVTKFIPLHSIGYPFALSQLVTNLLAFDGSYESLEEVINDMHVLLEDPALFLLDQYQIPLGCPGIAVNNGKLYGREEETACLNAAFCRVAFTGQCEAFFVSGLSRCGKSCLVRRLFGFVNAAGGHFVDKQFDEKKSESPLSVVLSALNDLCGLIVEKNSREELRDLYENIKGGTNLTLMSRVLPNINRLKSSDTAFDLHPYKHRVGSGLSYHMLVFAVMRLMRIISSQSRPVMIFLDDLQWADTASLDLVLAILSDLKGSNCVFFVGSYREQDVKQYHFIFEFIGGLSAYEVPYTELNLEKSQRA
ncbi:hypothetical protein HJC23_013176 [Cyclotella cryptica]|uniref:Orc1-like AAA ATPase domain-containing protein n=1 Tax=Cyclotella cryptica TaxID=29204 RepID=A0ABD3QRL7_9STRA|eukprot:CCRYP_003999-RA/>CCRYP_003999-RA protein AED:0.02 eAED:0.02 QI:74/1/1/1/1/1/2/567/566